MTLRIVSSAALAAAILAAAGGCATTPAAQAPAAQAEAAPAIVPSKRSLASFAKSNTAAPCYDRDTEPYTAVVDAHFHPRPFGGQALRPEELYGFFDRLGVRFVNYFGIGQVLDLTSGCTYYLDCPGTAALPSVKNDFVNGMETVAYPHPNLHIVLSMTFMDLANPQDAVKLIQLYDREYPGMFKWAGEVNVMKQALVPNLHEPSTTADIDAWAPFMKVLRERNIPITLHSDLGNDAEPTKYLHLMRHVLKKYPDNKIVWAHAGLSKELQHIDPKRHIAILQELFALSPNLMIDISWDVLYNAYHEFGPDYVAFIDANPDRVLPGSDFVAASNKDFAQYAKELDVTSRVNKSLGDEAFRKVALGENYFRLMGLDYRAPEICPR